MGPVFDDVVCKAVSFEEGGLAALSDRFEKAADCHAWGGDKDSDERVFLVVGRWLKGVVEAFLKH